MVDVGGVPPLKVHDHDVGVFELKSEKFTVPPVGIQSGVAEKFATGAQAKETVGRRQQAISKRTAARIGEHFFMVSGF